MRVNVFCASFLQQFCIGIGLKTGRDGYAAVLALRKLQQLRTKITSQDLNGKRRTHGKTILFRNDDLVDHVGLSFFKRFSNIVQQA